MQPLSPAGYIYRYRSVTGPEHKKPPPRHFTCNAMLVTQSEDRLKVRLGLYAGSKDSEAQAIYEYLLPLIRLAIEKNNISQNITIETVKDGCLIKNKDVRILIYLIWIRLHF